jgi:hypothetical protein
LCCKGFNDRFPAFLQSANTTFKFLVLALLLDLPLCALTIIMQREDRAESGKRHCRKGYNLKTARTKSTVLFLEFSDSSLKEREMCFSFVTRILSCYAIAVRTSFFAFLRRGR